MARRVYRNDERWWRRQVIASGLAVMCCCARWTVVVGQDGVARTEARVAERWPATDVLADGAEFPQKLEWFCFPNGWRPTRGVRARRHSRVDSGTDGSGNGRRTERGASETKKMDGGYQCRDHRRQGISASGGHEGVGRRHAGGSSSSAGGLGGDGKQNSHKDIFSKPDAKVVTFTVILNGERAWGVCLVDHERRIVQQPTEQQSGRVLSSGDDAMDGEGDSNDIAEDNRHERAGNLGRNEKGIMPDNDQVWWWPIGFCLLTRLPIVGA